MVPSTYPESAADRDRWILSSRPDRNVLNPRMPYSYFVEEERSADGEIVSVATILLTNRECPFRCVMCDLWRNTLAEQVPPGAIPEQIDFALGQLPPARVIKLYNGGSFFDPRAIPTRDYEAIAARLEAFDRVIVECHPAFVNDRCLHFRDLSRGRLELAMGLETADPETLEQLNKRMTLEQFAGAAEFLRGNGIDLRAFILVQPPFMRPEQALPWAQRSLKFAFDCGACAATLIPTRMGNGAMEKLAADGEFVLPPLRVLEAAAEFGLHMNRGRVFTDLWDLKMNATCNLCFDRRVERLRQMNLHQVITATVICDECEARND